MICMLYLHKMYKGLRIQPLHNGSNAPVARIAIAILVRIEGSVERIPLNRLPQYGHCTVYVIPPTQPSDRPAAANFVGNVPRRSRSTRDSVAWRHTPAGFSRILRGSARHCIPRLARRTSSYPRRGGATHATRIISLLYVGSQFLTQSFVGHEARAEAAEGNEATKGPRRGRA